MLRCSIFCNLYTSASGSRDQAAVAIYIRHSPISLAHRNHLVAVNLPTRNTPAIEARLIELKQEHRDLDLAIEALLGTPLHDELRLRRMKKRKLLLKDQIAFLDGQLHPDRLA